MNKNIKLSIIAASVLVVLGIGGTAYYRIDQLQQKRDYFQDKFNKTKAVLPKAIVIDKTTESSLFETNSTYTIQLQEDGKKSPSKLVVTAHLEHGLSYFLTGVIEGTSVGKIEGPFAKEFKSLDKLFDSKIKVLENDTLITDTKFVDLVAKDGTELKGITSYLESTKDNDTVKTNFKIGALNSPKGQDGKSLFNLNGFEVEYNGKANDIGNNHFSVKLAEVKSIFAQVNGISLVADSTVKGGLVDMKAALKVDKINAAKWENGAIDFQYSVIGVDESALKAMYDIGKKTAPQNEEEVQKSIVAMEEHAKKIFTRGIAINVDKLSFKAGQDSFNFSFKASLPKLNTFEEVSFEKNLKVSYNIETVGDLSHILAHQVNQQLQSLNITTPESPTTPEQVVVVDNQLKVNFEVANGKGTLNGKELSQEQNDVLHIVLSTIDEKIHSKEVTPVTPATQELVKPVTQETVVPVTPVSETPKK